MEGRAGVGKAKDLAKKIMILDKFDFVIKLCKLTFFLQMLLFSSHLKILHDILDDW